MKNKYMARKITVDGETFDSKKEYKHYLELLRMVDTGEIKDLCRQVEYPLIPTQREPSTEVYSKGAKKGQPKPGKIIELGCSYIADFQYTRDGETVVEDVKGYRDGGAYRVFKIKRKLVLQIYGIHIREV